jgi:hypothetical protein
MQLERGAPPLSSEQQAISNEENERGSVVQAFLIKPLGTERRI